MLDTALAIGGLARGRITEIFGATSCGKAALALQIVAHVQRGGGGAAWIDAEHAFSAAFAAQLGIDVTRLPVATPDSTEQAGEIARRLLASGALDLVESIRRWRWFRNSRLERLLGLGGCKAAYSAPSCGNLER